MCLSVFRQGLLLMIWQHYFKNIPPIIIYSNLSLLVVVLVVKPLNTMHLSPTQVCKSCMNVEYRIDHIRYTMTRSWCVTVFYIVAAVWLLFSSVSTFFNNAVQQLKWVRTWQYYRADIFSGLFCVFSWRLSIYVKRVSIEIQEIREHQILKAKTF